jgi:hypothetical protein
VYRELATILALRQEKMALRRGRQYLREISGDGQHFGLPHMIGGEIRSVVPWSRIFNDQEILLAMNTDPNQARTAWVIVDYDLHAVGDRLQCLYTTHPSQGGQELTITDVLPNMRAVLLTVPAAGFVIYE